MPFLPVAVKQSKVDQEEDRQMNWTTFANMNLWFDESEECLIEYGYVEDTNQVVNIFCWQAFAMWIIL